MFACTIFAPGRTGLNGQFFRHRQVTEHAGLAGGRFHDAAQKMVEYAISIERLIEPGDYFVVFASSNDGSVWTGTVTVAYEPPVPVRPQLVVVDVVG